MIVLVELITLLIGVCSALLERIPSHDASPMDPVVIDPCYPKPTPASPFISWDSRLLSADWWEIARTVKSLPRKYARRSADTRCVSPAGPAPDLRKFYWEPSCPYTVNWLSKFDWYIKGSKTLVETCYVLFPCIQKVRIVNCTRDYCSYRCGGIYPISSRNSVCLENNYQEYRNIWVFCPTTYDMASGIGMSINCQELKNSPKCLKKVTLSVPQCCECWSCWNMWVTKPELASVAAVDIKG